jgi:hypothetical protein
MCDGHGNSAHTGLTRAAGRTICQTWENQACGMSEGNRRGPDRPPVRSGDGEEAPHPAVPPWVGVLPGPRPRSRPQRRHWWPPVGRRLFAATGIALALLQANQRNAERLPNAQMTSSRRLSRVITLDNDMTVSFLEPGPTAGGMVAGPSKF